MNSVLKIHGHEKFVKIMNFILFFKFVSLDFCSILLASRSFTYSYLFVSKVIDTQDLQHGVK